MPDVPRSSPKENLRASQSNTYLSPGSLFNPRHKRNRSIFYADEILARHNVKIASANRAGRFSKPPLSTFHFLELVFSLGARTRDLLCDRQAVCLPLSFIYSLHGALDELVRMWEFAFSAEVRSNVGSWLRKYSDGESERYQNQHILRTGASISHCIVWMMLQHFNSRHRFAYVVFNHPFISLNLLVSASLLALAFRLPLLNTKVGHCKCPQSNTGDRSWLWSNVPVVRQFVVSDMKRISFCLAQLFGLGLQADSSNCERCSQKK